MLGYIFQLDTARHLKLHAIDFYCTQSRKHNNRFIIIWFFFFEYVHIIIEFLNNLAINGSITEKIKKKSPTIHSPMNKNRRNKELQLLIHRLQAIIFVIELQSGQ